MTSLDHVARPPIYCLRIEAVVADCVASCQQPFRRMLPEDLTNDREQKASHNYVIFLQEEPITHVVLKHTSKSVTMASICQWDRSVPDDLYDFIHYCSEKTSNIKAGESV